MIEFFISGKPVAKQSFRSTRSGRHYQSEAVKSWQDIVAHGANEIWKDDPLKSWLDVKLHFYLSKNQADVDNLAKAVLDGLQGIVYANDKQIFRLEVAKEISAEILGVKVAIKELL